MKGKIALCSRGIPGIITSDEKLPSSYKEGADYWPGVSLVDGSPWGSSKPNVIGTIAEIADGKIVALKAERDKLLSYLQTFVLLFENANEGAFENGVTHNGLDQGEVIAGRFYDDCRKFLVDLLEDKS